MTFSLDLINPKSLKHLSRHLQELIKSHLWVKMLAAMALGIITGVVLGSSNGWLSRDTVMVIGDWLAFPGRLFLALIQMIVVPLVFASVIRGLAAGGGLDQMKKLGIRIVLYFLLTTVVAISIGIAVALTIQPGHYIGDSLTGLAMEQQMIPDSQDPAQPPSISRLPEIITGILPQNPLGAMVQGDMLKVVIFAVILGLAMVTISPEQSTPLLEILGSVMEVCMTVVRWAMRLAPWAVFGLLAQITMRVGTDALLGMAVYVGTVLLGLLVLVIVYLTIVFAAAKISPLIFLRGARDVQLLAFSTSSSAAVLPLSIKTAEETFNVRPSVAQFLIPLGATINMDGTALYQGVATVFLAQVFGVELGPAALLLVIVTAVGASIGAPGTPGVGIVVLSMVLSSVGIPASGIALIIGVDRILDMSRTAVNVTGDLTAALVMDRLAGNSNFTVRDKIHVDI